MIESRPKHDNIRHFVKISGYPAWLIKAVLKNPQNPRAMHYIDKRISYHAMEPHQDTASVSINKERARNSSQAGAPRTLKHRALQSLQKILDNHTLYFHKKSLHSPQEILGLLRDLRPISVDPFGSHPAHHTPNTRWYIMKVMPGRESSVIKRLRQEGFITWIPQVLDYKVILGIPPSLLGQEKRLSAWHYQYHERIRTKPLLSGFVLVQGPHPDNSDQAIPFILQTIRDRLYVHGWMIDNFNGFPAALSSKELEDFQKPQGVSWEPTFGDPVRIRRGPHKGLITTVAAHVADTVWVDTPNQLLKIARDHVSPARFSRHSPVSIQRGPHKGQKGFLAEDHGDFLGIWLSPRAIDPVLIPTKYCAVLEQNLSAASHVRRHKATYEELFAQLGTHLVLGRLSSQDWNIVRLIKQIHPAPESLTARQLVAWTTEVRFQDFGAGDRRRIQQALHPKGPH